MSSKIYLWIEDRAGKAGFMFWNSLLKYMYPNIVVESKKNSSGLLKAVIDLDDTESRYVIVLDNSFDNSQAVMEQKLLKQQAEKRENVVLMNIICFEYILLEFKNLICWIYAPHDEFLEKRKKVISARERLVESIESGDMNYKDIKEIIEYDEHIAEHNIEQLSAKLLFDLTRNTGFEVSKGRIGDCWIKSCCGWENRMDNDICGLDDSKRLSVQAKMKCIYEGTCLKRQFHKTGLEEAL